MRRFFFATDQAVFETWRCVILRHIEKKWSLKPYFHIYLLSKIKILYLETKRSTV